MSEQITTTIETITPAKAEAWLERNSQNRRLDPKRVRHLTQAIRRGEWQINGDAIRFNGTGALLDGQHRLAAIAASGVDVESLVVRGLSTVSQTTMDQGKKRQLADVLSMRGYVNTRNLAAVVYAMWRLETFGVLRGFGILDNPTIEQGLATLDRHPGLSGALPKAQQLSGVGGQTSWWGPLVYVLPRISEPLAQYYTEGFATGAGLGPQDPVLLLRNRLMAEKAKKRRSLSAHIQSAMAIKAWNLLYDGENVAALYWRASGPAKEPFPAIKGWAA